MTNNSLIAILGIGLLAVIGLVVWSSNPSYQTPTPSTSYQTPPGTPVSTTTTTTTTTTKAGAPIVKTDSSATTYTSSAIVNGTVNPNGAFTTYWYEYGKTTTLGGNTAAYSVGSGYTTISTPGYITGLSSNTTYYFRLSARNALGVTNGATFTFKTNALPPPQGTAPTTTTTAATNVERTTANLHGSINPNGSQTTYWFEYGQTSELGTVTSFQSAGKGTTSSAVSVSISDLEPLTKYYFRLNAQNQFGTVNGAILNFTTKGPAAPTAPTASTSAATAVSETSARLNGSVNPNGDETSYWFEYSTDSLLGNLLVSSTPEQSLAPGTSTVNVSATVSNLNKSTKYYFRVVARNSEGTVRGNIQSFTTKP